MESQGQGLKTACLGTQFSRQCHLRNKDSSSGVLFVYFTDLLTWATYFCPQGRNRIVPHPSHSC